MRKWPTPPDDVFSVVWKTGSSDAVLTAANNQCEGRRRKRVVTVWRAAGVSGHPLVSFIRELVKQPDPDVCAGRHD